MAEVNAKLGLLISAKDEASAVFNNFFTALRSNLTSVSAETTAFKEKFSTLGDVGSTEAKQMTQALTGVNTTLNSIEQKLTLTGQTAKKTGEHFGTMAQMASLQDVGSRLEDIGHTITGFFGEAIKEGSHFQQQIDAIAATLNARLGKESKLTADQIEALTNKTLELGKAGFFSANELAETMYTLSREGLKYEQVMGGVMESVQNLAVATDSNLNRTADLMNDVVHSMGDTLQKEFGANLNNQFTEVANMISGAMHNARMTMEDFIGTLKYVGPQASTMGMSLKDVALAVGLLANNGIKGSQAGTTLRRMLTNVVPSTDAATTAMKELGLITADGTNKFLTAEGKVRSFVEIQETLRRALENLTPAQQQSALKTIFGQYALSGMSAIASTTAKEMKDLTADITQHSNAQQLANEKWDNTAGSIRRLTAHFETIIKKIGEDLLPLADKLISWAEGLMVWFDKLSPSTQKFVEQVGALIGVLALVSGTIMVTVASLGFLKIGLMAFIPEVTATAGAVGAVQTAGIGLIGTIGLVAAGIAAAGLAFYYAYNHSETFRKGVLDGLDSIKKFVETQVIPLVNSIGAKFLAFWNSIAPDLLKIFQSIAQKIRDVWGLLWPVLSAEAKLAWDLIKAIVSNSVDVILGLLTVIIKFLSGDWKGSWEAAGNLIKTVFNNALNFLKTMVTDFYNLGKSIISSFIAGFTSMSIPSPSISAPSIPSGKLGFNAQGTDDWRGGLTWVGEEGPELLSLPPHSQIFSNPKSMDMVQMGRSSMGGSSKVQNNNITINVNGVGKGGNEIGNDIARQIRLQMSMVSI